jgi:hypothetical protein
LRKLDSVVLEVVRKCLIYKGLNGFHRVFEDHHGIEYIDTGTHIRMIHLLDNPQYFG